MPPPRIFIHFKLLSKDSGNGDVFKKIGKNFQCFVEKKLLRRRCGESERVYFLIKGGKNSNFIAFSLSIPPKRRQIASLLYGKDNFPYLSSICGKTSNRLSFFSSALFPRNAPGKENFRTPERKRRAFGSCKSFAAECLFYAADEGKLTAFHKFFEEFGYFSPLC